MKIAVLNKDFCVWQKVNFCSALFGVTRDAHG